MRSFFTAIACAFGMHAFGAPASVSAPVRSRGDGMTKAGAISQKPRGKSKPRTGQRQKRKDRRRAFAAGNRRAFR